MTKHAQPQGLNRRRVAQLLAKSKNGNSAGARIDILSREFLGYPYEPNPLIGSSHTAEVFTASLESFDCVTYLEVILALASASNVDGFTEWLRRIRYAQGRIQWNRRNHYMTAWIRNNLREGILRPASMRGLPQVTTERILNAVPGLAAQRTRLKCLPKRRVPQLAAHLQSGDLIFFVSTRRNLDVFHAGIIACDGDQILLRHASRSQGCVVEQELTEFLKANRMAGVIVIRPRSVTERLTSNN